MISKVERPMNLNVNEINITKVSSNFVVLDIILMNLFIQMNRNTPNELMSFFNTCWLLNVHILMGPEIEFSQTLHFFKVNVGILWHHLSESIG